MNVEITGRHVLVTPALRTYVLKRLRKFSRILGDDISFHVIVDVEKERHSVEILMKTRLLNITGKGQTGDMYSSIVLAIEKLERQALKQKSKIIESKRQRAKAKSLADKSGTVEARRSQALRQRSGMYEEESQSKPMTPEEAVIELGQAEYPFVVFRNIESGDVNVLYRRKDGNLGLIHTD
jgi:putative sigma-54 modulation protein